MGLRGGDGREAKGGDGREGEGTVGTVGGRDGCGLEERGGGGNWRGSWLRVEVRGGEGSEGMRRGGGKRRPEEGR